jgi:hypothetical protein
VVGSVGTDGDAEKWRRSASKSAVRRAPGLYSLLRSHPVDGLTGHFSPQLRHSQKDNTLGRANVVDFYLLDHNLLLNIYFVDVYMSI